MCQSCKGQAGGSSLDQWRMKPDPPQRVSPRAVWTPQRVSPRAAWTGCVMSGWSETRGG